MTRMLLNSISAFGLLAAGHASQERSAFIHVTNPKKLIITGTPASIEIDLPDGVKPYRWSALGEALTLVKETTPGEFQLYLWSTRGLSKIADRASLPSWSPSEPTFVYSVHNGGISSYTVGGKQNRISPIGDAPVFARDGEKIAFVSSGSTRGMWVCDATGNNPRRVLSDRNYRWVAWSPDATKYAVAWQDKSNCTVRLSHVTGKVLKEFKTPIIQQLLWSQGGRFLAVQSSSGITIWDSKTARTIQTVASIDSWAEWRTSSKLSAVIDSSLRLLDYRFDPVSTSLDATAQIKTQLLAFSKVASISLDSGSPSTSTTFAKAPKPKPAQSRFQGFVESVDTENATFTMEVRSFTNADGKEYFYNRPKSQILHYDRATKFSAGTALNLSKASEISVVADAAEPSDTATLHVSSVFLPDAPIAPAAGKRAKRLLEEDGVCMDSETVPMIFPVMGKVNWSDTFLASRGGGSRRHHGQDLMAAKLTPLVATFDGVVHIYKPGGNAGYYMSLESATGWTTYYMHVNNDTPGTDDGQGGERFAFAPGLHTGMHVLAGQFLGWVGDSGNAEDAGSHCHFELRDEQAGGVLNATPSLNSATKIDEATLVYPISQKLLEGEFGWKGVIVKIEAERNVVVMDLVSEKRQNETKTVTSPRRVWIVVPDGKLTLENDPAKKISINDLKIGMFLTALGSLKSDKLSMNARLTEAGFGSD